MQQRHPGQAVVVRAHQRQQRTIADNPMSYEALSPEGVESFAMFHVTAAPGQSTGANPLQHGGDENLLVLSGRFELQVEGKAYTLGPGDSAFVPRGQRHSLKNVGTETGDGVFVLSPPEYTR